MWWFDWFTGAQLILFDWFWLCYLNQMLGPVFLNMNKLCCNFSKQLRSWKIKTRVVFFLTFSRILGRLKTSKRPVGARQGRCLQSFFSQTSSFPMVTCKSRTAWGYLFPEGVGYLTNVLWVTVLNHKITVSFNCVYKRQPDSLHELLLQSSLAFIQPEHSQGKKKI